MPNAKKFLQRDAAFFPSPTSSTAARVIDVIFTSNLR